MNKNIIEGNWEMFKGKIESEWGKLTYEPDVEAKGDIKQFQGYLQKQYGWAEEEAKEQFKKVEKMYKTLTEEDGKLDKAMDETSEKIDKVVDKTSEKIDKIFK